MKARAVVFAEAGRIELRDVTLRDAGVDEVVVDTHFSSISSGTERLLFDGRLPAPFLRFPLVPGYEAAGTVRTVGADVAALPVGEPVFVGGSMCYTDVASAFGGQSSRLIKGAASVVPLRRIPLDQAPLLALAATALHGVRRLGDVRGRRVVVLGMGALGQLAAQFVKMLGGRAIAADRSTERLAAAVADEKLDVSETPLEAQVGAPVPLVIEATGNAGEIARCARVLEPGGTIVLLGFYERLETSYGELFMKEANLLVSKEWVHADLLAARDAADEGAIDLAPLARHVVPVERYEQAYRTAFSDASVLKVVLQWA